MLKLMEKVEAGDSKTSHERNQLDKAGDKMLVRSLKYWKVINEEASASKSGGRWWQRKGKEREIR